MIPKLLQKKIVIVVELLLKITIPPPLKFFYELLQKAMLRNVVLNYYRKLVPNKKSIEAIAR
jgi:hypothetical protein